MKAISDRELSLYRKLIYSKAGICLSPIKKAFLEARLSRRIRELGMDSFQAYYQYVTQNQNGSELEQLLDRVSTNETIFFANQGSLSFSNTRFFRIGSPRAATDHGHGAYECGAPAVQPAKSPIHWR